MRIFGILLVASIVTWVSSCNPKKVQQQKSGAEVISLQQLKEKISQPSGKLKIINFWATWCKPCIEEMPYFENVANSNTDKVALYFISLDLIEDLTNVDGLIKKKQISANVLLLNETKYDEFMPQINEKWSGAIPATLLVDAQGNEYFYEKSFSEKELSDLIAGLL